MCNQPVCRSSVAAMLAVVLMLPSVSFAQGGLSLNVKQVNSANRAMNLECNENRLFIFYLSPQFFSRLGVANPDQLAG